MSTSFLTVVEDVKQLSTDEKEELRSLLEQYLIEERRERRSFAQARTAA